ncbi:PadR family transcriptional regulator [Candidatus Micrarchaeota archaeon]|nr:MAG: PadR family transcriptional regulator [Candidatus Micrarchaeota archaeon]
MLNTAATRRLRTSLTTGNMWIHILSLLKRKKLYAYNLRSEMQKHAGFSQGMIMNYLILYKLEAEGLIRSEFEGRRKYYYITVKGKAALSDAKAYLRKLASTL